MIDRIGTITGTAVGLVMLTGPAVAGTLIQVSVPEPASMSLSGLGVAGAFVARKFIRRK